MAKARKEAGLNQAQMAARLGRSEKTIAAWEVERSQPRQMMNVLAEWAKITRVPIWWLLDLAEYNVPQQPTLDDALADALADLAESAPPVPNHPVFAKAS